MSLTFERALRRPGVFRRLSSFSLVEKLSDSSVRGKTKRRNDLDEFLAVYPEVKELIGDGSEFKIQRPKRKLESSSAWTLPGTGEDSANGWVINKRGRRNHPLTDVEKKENKRLSKVRILVERAIRRVKVFRRLAETVVLRSKGSFDESVDAVINLANFKILVRSSA
jgi:hypothetical protein